MMITGDEIKDKNMNIFDQKILLSSLNMIFAWLATHIDHGLAILATIITICVSIYALLQKRVEYKKAKIEAEIKTLELLELKRKIENGKA